MSNPYMEEENPYAEVDTIPKTENILQRAMKISRGFNQGFADMETLGGTALARYGAEKLVPLPPEAESQYQEMMSTSPLAKGIGSILPVARGAQQLGKFGIDALFGKQISKNAIPKATGKLTESIQEVIKRSKANPEQLSVPKDEVIKVLKEQYAKSAVPQGEQAAAFRRWLKVLEGTDKNKSKLPDKLTADIISELEVKFGKAAKFGKGTNDPILQQGAKEVNRYASGRLDNIAEKAGVPEFVKRSADKSKLLRESKMKPNTMQKLAREIIKLGAAGAIGGTIASKMIPRD